MDLSTQQLSGGARIRHVFKEDFGRVVADLMPAKEISDDEICTVIKNGAGVGGEGGRVWGWPGQAAWTTRGAGHEAGQVGRHVLSGRGGRRCTGLSSFIGIAHMHVHTYCHACTHICMCSRMHAHVLSRMHTLAHMYTHSRTHTRAHTHTCMHRGREILRCYTPLTPHLRCTFPSRAPAPPPPFHPPPTLPPMQPGMRRAL